MKRHFTCTICERVLPAGALSRSSLVESFADSRLEAINLLDEPVCIECESEEEEDVDLEEVLDGEDLGRNDVESWHLSGTHIDPAKLQAYRLSY